MKAAVNSNPAKKMIHRRDIDVSIIRVLHTLVQHSVYCRTTLLMHFEGLPDRQIPVLLYLASCYLYFQARNQEAT